MLPVVWSSRSRQNYGDIIDYLSSHSIDTAIKLDERVDKLMKQISRFPFSFRASAKEKRFRKAVVTKHFSFVYQVKGKYVYVVAFIDNRSPHEF
jgi:plasmid stabilization system protein ParE